jgi:hypothetical protein
VLINLKEPCVLYIGRAHRYPPNTPFYIFFPTNLRTKFFKLSPFFFSSKCRLFHNATFLVSVLFAFYIQGVLKFKCQISVPKRLVPPTCSGFQVPSSGVYTFLIYKLLQFVCVLGRCGLLFPRCGHLLRNVSQYEDGIWKPNHVGELMSTINTAHNNLEYFLNSFHLIKNTRYNGKFR